MATFKARARALDMLGRQQIAGIPTAISELFKNAHDAYADHVDADFFRLARLFILRDDGMGMTREDFETRWLTLGTESKVGASAGLVSPPVDRDKEQRPIMGEKGIGRLAIAAIGPQVLVLTRAKRASGLGELVAAFIHWGLFEVPGIDLDQVEIPVCTFAGGTLPQVDDIKKMVQSVRAVVEKLAVNIDNNLMHRIRAELDSFSLDVPLLLNRYPGPTLTGEGHGTHFYILPADESITANLDVASGDIASPLTKLLIGFANTMTPGHPEPHMRAAFRDHKAENSADDLIEEQEFWTPEEFWNADHHFEGEVDEYGQFYGTVSVYGSETNGHVIAWPDARGKPTACGPFRVSVAYVQGNPRESTLPPQDFARVTGKLTRIGGLYIFKDGIRILPYGNNDFDFLDIEQRRNKGAGYYFFSYRRIFGAIQISQVRNSALSEKAGREGFRENRAYREFKSILINLFVQIAADFFRAEGTRADLFTRRREELKRTDVARKRHQEQSSAKKRSFIANLESSLTKIQAREPERKVDLIIEEIGSELTAVALSGDNAQAATVLLRSESAARRGLENIRMEYRLTKPRGVALSRQTSREWEAYLEELARLDTEVFMPATHRLDKVIAEASRQAHVAVTIRRRVEEAIRVQADTSLRTTRQLDRELRSLAETTANQAIALARESLAGLEIKINAVVAEFARTDLSNLPDHEIVELRQRYIADIERTAEQKRELLEGVSDQLRSLTWDLDESGRFVGMSETIEALDEERLELRERADLDVELTQLGLAIQVINHEFGASIKAVRDNLKTLRAWADVNPKLTPVYDGIRTSFEHLDSYLTLFTPLNRRLYRYPVDISGEDIGGFLQDLFRERLVRHSIAMEQTSRFKQKEIISYPSTFYPVFVNLVDNAIYWLANRAGERRITLDADTDSFLIHDSGPGIPIQDRDAVFEFGFSRKPGGRGLGLYIARDVLKKVGYTLTIDSPPAGTTFRIRQAAGQYEGVQP